MIRPATADETALLVSIAQMTAVFKPLEIEALQEVLDDYYAANAACGHCAIVYERAGQVLGFAYYAPAAMTERTWQLWWIVVQPERQAQGIGSEMLKHLESDILKRHRGRVLFIETSSLPSYEPTRCFYRKHHFEEHAVLRDFYSCGDSMVVFRKVLGE